MLQNVQKLSFLMQNNAFLLTQHKIIQHQKSPGWRRFGAGHAYLVRD